MAPDVKQGAAEWIAADNTALGVLRGELEHLTSRRAAVCEGIEQSERYLVEQAKYLADIDAKRADLEALLTVVGRHVR